MASYTYTSTASDDALLNRALIRINADRANQNLTAFTIGTLVQYYIAKGINQLALEQANIELGQLIQAYNLAGPVGRAALVTAAAGTPPGP
jgi:hypothetical protein